MDKIIKPHELRGDLISLYKLLFLLFLGNFICVYLGWFFFPFVTGLTYSSSVFLSLFQTVFFISVVDMHFITLELFSPCLLENDWAILNPVLKREA